jgi:long-chain acyl-CoA synthetase
VEDFLKSINFPFTVGYGMTECGPLISYASWKENPPGAVGRPIDYLELKIATDDPIEQAGEIMVRGENVMLGYYKNEEATREALDSDGWLHTGDLGLVDKNGFVYIKGRSKNLILGPSGQNIYPEEIESRLNAMPFIQESVVVGEGGTVIALVYPDWEAVDAIRKQDRDGEEWLKKKMEENRLEANKTLPGHIKISRIVLQAGPFEKTPTQKIKRYLYRM